MATTELEIRQLADEGGTSPIAPVTVTDAVLKGDGTTLTEELTALNNSVDTLNDDLTSANIASVTRIATTATTGTTGNILLPYANDGKRYIVAPFALANVYFRAWVSHANNQWYLTAVNPNTGETINNTSMDIRYLLIVLKSA